MEDGRPVNSRVVEDVDFTYGMIMAQCEDFYQDHMPPPTDSVGSFVRQEFEEKLSRYHGQERHIREMILEQRILGECIITGCDSLDQVALSEVGSFEEIPGVHYVIPPGFESIVSLLNKSVPRENLMLNHPVSRIDWSQDDHKVQCDPDTDATNNVCQVCVECQNGSRFYADHVLSTVPLGYLKKHASRLYTPPLPENKTLAIDRVAFGTVNKVLLEFDGQVLPDGVVRLEMVWDRSDNHHEDLANNWYKKIGSYEAILPNIVVGKHPFDEL